MMTPNQKKLGLLVILLIVLAATILIGRRINQGPNPVVVQAQGQKTASATPQQGDARIRLDLLNPPKIGGEFGKNNLFQYRVSKPPEPTPRPGPAPAPQPPPDFTSLPPRPQAPAAPPPPPPIPLKFVGIASVEPNSKALIATLIDDKQNQVNLKEGEIWMGRYRVVRVTETSVDVEDLQTPRRQTLPLAKQ